MSITYAGKSDVQKILLTPKFLWVSSSSFVCVHFLIGPGLGVSQSLLLLGVSSRSWVFLITYNSLGYDVFMLYAHHVAIF